MAEWHLRRRIAGLALAVVAASVMWMPTDVGQAADLAQPTIQQWGGERWIDVNLSSVRIRAYEGNTPVYTTWGIKGIGGWETPTGTYYIQRRVYNERMVGPGWDVSDVLFTQYFTEMGHAIHYNWWSGNFGGAGSKGCLGLTYDASAFFWEWAGVGTPIEIHW